MTRIAFGYVIFAFIVGLILPDRLRAQQRNMAFELFTTDEGLSSHGILSILHDSRGFMWFGTTAGLNQYDGYRFTRYANQPLDTTSLAHNRIHALYEEPSGIIWVGTRGGGLDRFEPETGTFSHYKHEADNPHSLTDNNVHAIYEDRAGTLWVGTDGGLNSMDRSTGRFVRYEHEHGRAPDADINPVHAIYEDRKGSLWVGTRRGLEQVDRTAGITTSFEFDAPGSVPIYAIYEDNKGGFWLGTGYGLARFDVTTGRFLFINREVLATGNANGYGVFVIHEDRSGRLWAGAENGINHIDPATYQLRPVSFGNDAANRTYAVRGIGEDPSGVLWFGTDDGGLYKLNPATERFAYYTYEPGSPQSLSNAHVRALYEDRSGTLWFGTRGGLDRYDPATGVFTSYGHERGNPRSLSGTIITRIFEDLRGGLWVVAYNAGLNRFDPATGAAAHYTLKRGDPNSVSSKVIRAVYESPAEPGILWIGTKKGLDRLDLATETFTHYRHDPADPTSLSHNSIRVLYEDRAGTFWVGTDGGLNALDRAEGTFTRYAHEPGNPHGLINNEIRSIYEDQTGTLWVGTKGGLNKFIREHERFLWYTKEEGLPGTIIQGFVEDDRDRLWICSNKGISRFDPAEETFRTYEREDGLINSFLEFNTCIKSRSGHLLIGGNNGVDVFHPDSLRDNPHVPPIVITDFKTLGQTAAFDQALHAVDAITLPYKDNFFSFEFAALDYRNPSSNQYAYQLEGLDAEWVYAGTRRLADYTDVDPGEYVFRVKGSNNDGLWNEEGIAVKVTITPPFWQVWWFRLTALLGVALLLLASYQVRVRAIRIRNTHLEVINEQLNQQIAERRRAEEEREVFVQELEAKNAELERFTYTVSHDLKSPLVTIKGFVGLLEQDTARGRTERMKTDIAQINRAVDTMYQLLSDLLELSRVGRLMNSPEAVSLSELAREAAEVAAGNIVARGVGIKIAPAMPMVYGDRIRLLEVMQNLLQNAVKFMGDQPSPLVEIGAGEADDDVICFIRDNGIGIAPQYHEKVFGLFERLNTGTEGTGIGLALVKRIVEVHGGRVWVESEGEGCGTTFWFTLPRNGASAYEKP